MRRSEMQINRDHEKENDGVLSNLKRGKSSENVDVEAPNFLGKRARVLPARLRDAELDFRKMKCCAKSKPNKAARKRSAAAAVECNKLENNCTEDKLSLVRDDDLDLSCDQRKDEDHYGPEDFTVGDMVWARLGSRYPAWPALTVDPAGVPQGVLNAYKPRSTCVMYFGKEQKRDYGWIIPGWIYPFMEYLDRFKCQTSLPRHQMPAYSKAIEEAYLYGHLHAGFDVNHGDRVAVTWERESHVASGSSDQNFCLYKDVEEYCTELVENVKCEASASQRHVMDEGHAGVPEQISVTCTRMEGIYYPALHLVECKCGSCGTQKWKLGEWEHHTGSRAKKWKSSVRVKDCMLPLGKWMLQHNLQGVNPLELSMQRLFTFLEGKYEPLCPKWTPERCAVCKWDEDNEDNEIIVCNRCQIGVHQTCYGVRNDVDFASWVCKACETPATKRECCLCPIKGGALKPTNIDSLWVHVTCGWFRPEIEFQDRKTMEPAVGLLNITPDSFTKACILCKQIHGSCTQCCKCLTSFHAMCALQEGFRTELHGSKKSGRQFYRMVSYCASHRTPNRKIGIIDHEETGALNLLQRKNHLRSSKGPGLVVSGKTAFPELSAASTSETESAARCRTFEKSINKKIGIEPRFHLLMGPTHHSLDAIYRLNKHGEAEASLMFCTLKERLIQLKQKENQRVCFGKSGIHGWGLFARQSIQEGEMVLEYQGELIRRSVADVREGRNQLEGKDCYFFKISEEVVIDATVKGNIARLINHSCMPNCFARIFRANKVDKIILIAKTDVSAGDELTLYYRYGENEEKEQKLPCSCGAPNCRKIID